MKKGFKRGDRDERAMARSLDKLAEYEAFIEEFAPAFRKMLQSGKTAEEIYKEIAPLAAARIGMTIISERDATKAISAAKDVLDRQLGKPKESKTIEHKYADLKDAELDALLISEAEALEDTGHGDPH